MFDKPISSIDNTLRLLEASKRRFISARAVLGHKPPSPPFSSYELVYHLNPIICECIALRPFSFVKTKNGLQPPLNVSLKIVAPAKGCTELKTWLPVMMEKVKIGIQFPFIPLKAKSLSPSSFLCWQLCTVCPVIK